VGTIERRDRVGGSEPGKTWSLPTRIAIAVLGAAAVVMAIDLAMNLIADVRVFFALLTLEVIVVIAAIARRPSLASAVPRGGDQGLKTGHPPADQRRLDSRVFLGVRTSESRPDVT
jgi:hypothetical protein